MEVGQPPCAAHALVTARVACWRAVVGCVRWSAWKPMKAFKTPVRQYARIWWDRERALVVRDAYLGRWARCDCNLGGGVASSGLAPGLPPGGWWLSRLAWGALLALGWGVWQTP